MMIQQLLRRDVKQTIRNVTAQVNGFPTIAGSTATDGSQTVRKLARAPPRDHSPPSSMKTARDGAAGPSSMETARARPHGPILSKLQEQKGRIRASNIQRAVAWQSSMETARRGVTSEHSHSQVLNPNVGENMRQAKALKRSEYLSKEFTTHR